MAAFSMKRTGLGAGPLARKVTISGADMSALLADRREAFGKVLDVDGTTMRDMTDDEVTVRLFDLTLQAIVGQASANIREKAARVASAAVQAIPAQYADDLGP